MANAKERKALAVVIESVVAIRGNARTLRKIGLTPEDRKACFDYIEEMSSSVLTVLRYIIGVPQR